MIRLLHVSDLHFGKPAVPAMIEAIEDMVEDGRFDVVAISGDLSQRARPGELQRGRAFIRMAERVSRTIVVPGNHDVKWWRAPLGLGRMRAVYTNYRRYISNELEPVLRVPGATFVGLNTAHGVQPHTLTWNVRDVGVVGDLSPHQLERARTMFAESPPDDIRVLVMHHNLMKGDLSRRYGLVHTKRAVSGFRDLRVDVVLCGHDHQEAIHFVEHTQRGTVVSTAGTLSDRSRGGRPSSINVLALEPGCTTVATRVWSPDSNTFLDGPTKQFPR